jgi:S-DNA-T family DNA segregation ATPase FtsK/SpoIIIE
VSDTKPPDTRHLRKDMVDLDGDGQPDWALAGNGSADEPDFTDPFVLTTEEVEARGEDYEVAHRSGDEYGDLIDLEPPKRTVAEWIIASATEIKDGPMFGRVFGTREGRMAFRVAVKRLTKYGLKWAVASGPPWLIVRMWWVVRGIGIAVYRAWFWITDREGLNDVRAIPEAAKRQDSKKSHKEEIRDRWVAVGIGAAASLAFVALCLLLPEDPYQPWGRLVLFALAPTAAGVWLIIIGKPEDKKWAGERVLKRGGWSRLTEPGIREALLKPKLVKDVADVRFAARVRMLSHGDLAFVQLPQGVTALDIMARRDKLASGLGVLLNQCYPFEARKKHLPGWPVDVSTMGLLVTHKPVSEMDLSEFPRWPGLNVVARRGRTSYFKAFPLMHDMLFNPVKFALAELNTIVAGRMGVGKSAWLMNIIMYAALDPTVQLIVAEFKGVADFAVGSDLYSDYVEGLEDEDFARAVEILEWLEQELKRRGARIKAARKAGKAPKGKVTPELADDPNSGLHPILFVIDEFHMLSMHREYGPRAMFLVESIIKRGRALAIHAVLATQIPNAKTVSGGIMSSIGTAICGGVKGWRANNMILGDGSYEAGWRATDLKPGNEEERGDAGFAWVRSILDPVLTHAYYPSPSEVEKVFRYAHVNLRKEQVVGHPADPDEVAAPRDVIWDVEEVFRELLPGVDKAQWNRLQPLMAERWPASYGHVKTGAQLSVIVRKASTLRDATGRPVLDEAGKERQIVRSVTVKGGPGKAQGEEASVNGCHLAEIVAAREAQAMSLPGQRPAPAIEGPDEDYDDLAGNDEPQAPPQASPQARGQARGQAREQGRTRKPGNQPASKPGNVLALAPVRSAAWDDEDLAASDPADEDDFESEDDAPAGPGDDEDDATLPAPRLQPEEDQGLTPLQMAAEMVVTTQFGSSSMLQRKMKIGYAEAQRLLGLLAAHGIVDETDPQNPTKAREVLIPMSELDEALEGLRGADPVP